MVWWDAFYEAFTDEVTVQRVVGLLKTMLLVCLTACLGYRAWLYQIEMAADLASKLEEVQSHVSRKEMTSMGWAAMSRLFAHLVAQVMEAPGAMSTMSTVATAAPWVMAGGWTFKQTGFR